MKRHKKLIFYVITCVLVLLPTFSHTWGADAQTDWKYPEAKDVTAGWVDPGINSESTGKISPLITLQALSCELTKSNTEDACGAALPPAQANRGVIQAAAGTVLTMYSNPPADLAWWARDTGESLGLLPKSAYAQGVGFTGLQALIPIWKSFRNIAYILLSLAIVAVGFMIMFRRKIDPHTVVTIQNSIPRIIMALILITFSYAIVAMFIDLMYIVLLMAYGIFHSATPALPEYRQGIFSFVQFNPSDTSGVSVKDVILKGNLAQAFHIVFPGNFLEIGNLAANMFAGGTFDFLNPQTWANLPGVLIGGILGGFLLNILILILFIRLIFLFLGAYIQIILALIFGPLQILLDVFPGSNAIGNWIKNIVANLGVFAIGGIMFMLSIYFSTFLQALGSSGRSIWVPPYSFIFSDSASAIAALFAIGVLMLIPSLANQFKQSIKAAGIQTGGALNLGPAIGIGHTAMDLLFQRSHGASQKRIEEQLGRIGQDNASLTPGGNAPGGHG